MDVASPTLIGGLLLGLASSLYCAGMCGGIASGLLFLFEPKTRLDRLRVLMQAQLGRITSYMLAGGAVGYAGAAIYGAIVPGAVYEVLHWSSAAMLIWIGLVIAGVLSLPDRLHRASAQVSHIAARAVRPLSGIVAGPFLGGITWGFIPCPTVYGALLTAWSAAGIAGPVLINYLREYNINHGIPKAQAYNGTMYIMAGLLVLGFICNFLVKAVDARYHMKSDADSANPSGATPQTAKA